MYRFARTTLLAAGCAVQLIYSIGNADDAAIHAPDRAPSNTMGTIVESRKDSAGRTVREVDADGKVMTYIYSNDGTLTAKVLPNGEKISVLNR